MRKVLFFLLLFSIGCFAFSQDLWEGTKYGMSVDQVKNLFPSAVTPSEQSTLRSGGKALLQLENIIIGDGTFRALFYFNDSGLTQVNLIYIKGLYIHHVFDEISKLLTAKHGKPTSIERDYYSRQTTWVINQTKIIIFWLESFGLRVVYQAS